MHVPLVLKESHEAVRRKLVAAIASLIVHLRIWKKDEFVVEKEQINECKRNLTMGLTMGAHWQHVATSQFQFADV
jgi:hypothetical protein